MAGFWHDEAAGAWLAEMRSTAYAFALADGGATLRHLHWGAPLPRAALAGLLTTATDDMPRCELRLSQGRERPDEYVPWGGLRYDEPSLKAEFGDGTRGVEWRVAGHRVTRQGPVSTLEVDLADTAYPQRVGGRESGDVVEPDARRVSRGRHQIVRETSGQELSGIVIKDFR